MNTTVSVGLARDKKGAETSWSGSATFIDGELILLLALPSRCLIGGWFGFESAGGHTCVAST